MTGCGSACSMPIVMGGGSIGCGGACSVVAIGGYRKKSKKCNCKTKKTSTVSSKKNNTTKPKKPSKK